MRILLTGATGQLGRQICRSPLPCGTSLIAASRNRLDLRRPGDIAEFVSEARPDLIINTAAYTAVDRAESESDLAFTINRDGAEALAQAAAALDIPIVHFSTDYVFNGEKDGEWSEDDEPAPLNIFGKSKLAGEIAVAAANPRHLIIRVSWLYAAHGTNFLQTMLKLGRQRGYLTVVTDQFGRPTSAAELVEAAMQMATQARESETQWGIYHFSNSGEAVNWYGFTREIFRIAAPWSGVRPLIDPINTEALNAPAARPKNAVLALDKIEQVFSIKPRPWEDALADVMEQLRPDHREKSLLTGIIPPPEAAICGPAASSENIEAPLPSVR